MSLKINFKSVCFYVACGAAMAFLNLAVDGVPLSFALFFSMLLCGTSIIATPVLFVAASVAHLSLTLSLLSLFEAVFCALVVFLYRRTGRKIRFEAVIYLIISLAPYVVLAPWNGIEDVITSNGYLMRSVAAAVIMIFTLFCFKSVYALLFRAGRCRLKEDELICLSVTYAACGSGLYIAIGGTAYLCLAACAIAFTVRLMRSPSAIIVIVVVSLPAVIRQFSLTPMTALTVICICALVFANAGRFAPCVATAALTAGYTYLSGGYGCSAPLIVLYAILLLIACALPCIPSDKKLQAVKRRLLAQTYLSDTAVSRAKRNTGERLFRISEVFREIERAFNALDEDVDENAARQRIFRELSDKVCRNCERRKRCERTNVQTGLKKLIDAGCAKGRVNLIDLPSEMTSNCSRPTDVLSCLNGILTEYRRFRLESENARSGRRLLADQAHGVAEALKSCAVDLSRTHGEFKEAETQVKKSLAMHGVSCPELYINGENAGEVCAVICGKINVKATESIISDKLNRRFILKDKIDYDSDKSCYFFGAPPVLDAVFGVAYAIKNGEKVSGDTHSVIRINDRTFLMALSDGMGSGEYARKVSDAAISLIEAFYRAEMPEGTVLKTINKLLSFNRDERFTCIDIAAVNLDTGRADFVKIGSPAGVILREGEIKILESSSLPMGILENLKPAVCTEILKSGDIVVFMSDGITSAFPSATEMYEFLQGMHPLNPQNLADKILEGALSRRNGTVTDDMTVLCTRIFENG